MSLEDIDRLDGFARIRRRLPQYGTLRIQGGRFQDLWRYKIFEIGLNPDLFSLDTTFGISSDGSKYAICIMYNRETINYIYGLTLDQLSDFVEGFLQLLDASIKKNL